MSLELTRASSAPSHYLTIVIPAYNEAAAIRDVVRGIRSQLHSLVAEVIVVDDASDDGTGLLAQKAGATVIRHRQNRGYGAALKTGIRAAKTDFVMTMDADAQHRLQDVKALWDKCGENDLVIGARQGLLHSRLWRMPGKWLLWMLASYLMRQRIPDLNSGLRLMRREVILRYMHLYSSGFSFSTTSTMVMLSRGYAVAYVPIRVNPRRGSPSRVRIRTGLDSLILLLRLGTLFNPLRLFLPLCLVMLVAGFAWGFPMVMQRQGVSVGALLALIAGLIFFAFGLLSDQISQMRLERFENPEETQDTPLAPPWERQA